MTDSPVAELASPAPADSPPDEFQTTDVLTVVGGHFIHDMFTGFVAPLLPVIIEKLALNYTQAGLLSAIQEIPSLLHPFIGYSGRRINLTYFIIFMPAITATIIGSLGLASTYTSLVALMLVVGLTTTLFHSPAPALVGQISGKRVTRGMSFFMAGGELGRALAPLLVAWAIGLWAFEGLYRLMIIGWLTSAILFWRLRDVPSPAEGAGAFGAILRAASRLFIPLSLFAFLRTFSLVAFTTFLPTFMTEEGSTLIIASGALTLFQVGGIIGSLSSDFTVNKVGRRRLMVGAIIATAVLMVSFLLLSGPVLAPLLLGAGLLPALVTPLMLAMVQEYMPENRVIANGLLLLVLFVSRPIAALGIGFMGDNLGLNMAFLISALIPLLGIPMIFFLPKEVR